MPIHDFYSIRMRAAKGGSHEKGGKHISGGEILVQKQDFNQKIQYLMEKAFQHERGEPDFLQIVLEKVDDSIEYIRPLPVVTHKVNNAHEGIELAKQKLSEIGIPLKSIESGFRLLKTEKQVRGAILIDVDTGKRIDTRGDKGVRVSRFDWCNNSFRQWIKQYNLKNSSRIKEALGLASKVSTNPNTVAELCWSDDPSYVTGYVADKRYGYQRISVMKENGDDSGGRIFFVNGSENLDEYIFQLERQPVLINLEGKPCLK